MKSTYIMYIMNVLKGVSAAPGIAIGRIYLYLDENYKVPRYDVKLADLPGEMRRYRAAVQKASEEIDALKVEAAKRNLDKESGFLDAHMLMLSDPEFDKQIEKNLNKYLKNIEWILFITVKKFISALESTEDLYLRERSVDMYDVAKRVFNHLMFKDRTALPDLKMQVVLVSNDLLPSDTLMMRKDKVKGIALNGGGKTSHTAILARAFQIPAVLGLSTITDYARSGDRIIVDGNRGLVIVDPDKDTLKKYRMLRDQWTKYELSLKQQNKLPCVTKDGEHIHLHANIEMPEEIDSVIEEHADEVGLFRSEFIFMQNDFVPTEDEQFEAYTKVLKAMKNLGSVAIRTIDVGGDKLIPGLDVIEERNPLLGWRSIRFCMEHKDILRTQLRALLRASVFGKLRIMFPMISGVGELNALYEILNEVKDDLKRKKIPYDKNIPVGIMIEVPSAAVTSDILAKKVDFFSIGTNDLTQYTIAVDRGNEKVAYLYDPFHPAVLRMIKTVIENANKANIPVGLCGELAGEPRAAAVLLGLGLKHFSMAANSIAEVKKVIREIRMDEAEELAEKVLKLESADEINKLVKKWMEERIEYTE